MAASPASAHSGRHGNTWHRQGLHRRGFSLDPQSPRRAARRDLRRSRHRGSGNARGRHRRNLPDPARLRRPRFRADRRDGRRRVARRPSRVAGNRFHRVDESREHAIPPRLHGSRSELVSRQEHGVRRSSRNWLPNARRHIDRASNDPIRPGERNASCDHAVCRTNAPGYDATTAARGALRAEAQPRGLLDVRAAGALRFRGTRRRGHVAHRRAR